MVSFDSYVGVVFVSRVIQPAYFSPGTARGHRSRVDAASERIALLKI